MRTTVRLDEALLREAKQHAARTGRTLTSIMEESLRQFLTAARHRSRTSRFHVVPFKGDGLRPGVDIDNAAALLELMEEGVPPEKRR